MNSIHTKYKSLPVQLRASFWFLVCTVLHRSITVITTPIFTRMLSEYEYGKYGVFTSWMGILTCFVTMFIYSEVYPQAIVKFSSHKDKYSSGMQGLTLTIVVFWLIIYIAFRSFWQAVFELNTSQMLAMFVIMWANAVFGFWSAYQRVEYKYRALLIVTLFEAILQPLLSVALIKLSPDKLNGLVWAIAIATFISYSYLFVIQINKGRVFFDKNIWGYTLKLAIPLIPHYLSSVLLNSSDRIMIQKLVGEEAAGIYNLAYTVSICGTMINQAMLQTLQPWMFQKIKNKQFNEIKKLAYPALIAIAGVNLLIILFTPEIIKLFGPESYYEAIWVMPPITLSVFFMFMHNLFISFEFYYEKPFYVSAATIAGAIINIVLNYIFIQIFGYYAAGYTTLFCYVVFAIAHYCFMRKICREEIDDIRVYKLRILLIITIIFVALGFVIMVTYNYSYIRYSLVIIIILICFIMRKAIKGFVIELIGNRKIANKTSNIE